MTKNIIELQNISKAFHGELALSNIKLDIRDGEFLTLLGPSGCGKTTLLRLLSGFEQPDQGSITISGQDVTELTPEERHVNMVFQSYALFPHMSVYDNVAFGLRCKKIKEAEIRSSVMQALEMVHLEHFTHRKPGQLSGGQQQRVAIARAVVNKPSVLLLDEPLSALDYHLRKKMQIELKALQRQIGITFVLVTHDQEEALSMSDRLVVMHNGTIEQVGTPREVYEEPNNLYVAKFIGETNIFETTITNSDEQRFKAKIEGRDLQFDNKKQFTDDETVSIIIRPEDLRVWRESEVENTNDMLPGTIEEAIYKGSTVDLIVKLDGGKSIFATEFFDEDDEDLEYNLGEKVWVHWLPGWEVVLPHEES